MPARDPNASNAAPAQPSVISLEPEPEAMELSPSIAPTSPPEVVMPIEVEPPVTGSNAEPMLKERVFPGLNKFTINPDAPDEAHDVAGRTIESVLKHEYQTSYVCREQMDALLQGVLTPSQKDDHVKRMVFELDLAKEVFSPSRPTQLLNPNDTCFPSQQSQVMGTEKVPPPTVPRSPRASKYLDTAVIGKLPQLPKVYATPAIAP